MRFAVFLLSAVFAATTSGCGGGTGEPDEPCPAASQTEFEDECVSSENLECCECLIEFDEQDDSCTNAPSVSRCVSNLGGGGAINIQPDICLTAATCESACDHLSPSEEET